MCHFSFENGVNPTEPQTSHYLVKFSFWPVLHSETIKYRSGFYHSFFYSSKARSNKLTVSPATFLPTHKKRCVLGMTLNWIWWWGSSSEDLGNVWFGLVWSGLVWFGLVLWHINHCRLFNAKSSLYIYIKYIWFGLVGFYIISTFVGYVMPNTLYTYILNIHDLFWFGLWHINHCRLFNAKLIFIY